MYRNVLYHGVDRIQYFDIRYLFDYDIWSIRIYLEIFFIDLVENIIENFFCVEMLFPN